MKGWSAWVLLWLESWKRHTRLYFSFASCSYSNIQARISRLFTSIHELSLWGHQGWWLFLFTNKEMQRLNFLIKVTQQVFIQAKNKSWLWSMLQSPADILCLKGCTGLGGKPCTKSTELFIQNVCSSSDCFTEVTLYFYLFVYLNFALVRTSLYPVKAGVTWFWQEFCKSLTKQNWSLC